MQFTESIFHPAFHVWGKPRFQELQSGVFLPFCFVWVWLFFFLCSLRQLMWVIDWLFCFSADLIGFVRPK